LVIEAAIRVHKSLGPGFLESFYEEALAIELSEAGTPFERQKSIVLKYKGNPIGEHRLDLLIHGKLVVEPKAIMELIPPSRSSVSFPEFLIHSCQVSLPQPPGPALA
jgi:GxxExxY protein